jgi:hypothetical protein
MLTRVRLIAVALVGAVILLGLPFGHERTIVFERVSELRSPLLKLFVAFGGKVSDPASDYPASLFAEFATGCSATLVGADSLLTAAHCAKWSPQVKLRINGADIDAYCTASESADIALCQLETYADGMLFDVIERDAAMAAKDRTIRLTGWAGSPANNVFAGWLRRFLRRLGFGKVFWQGTGTIAASTALLTVTGNVVNGAPVVLKPGDSGGAGYAEQGSRRTIIGVNNCGGPFCGNGADTATSGLTNLTDSSVAQWIQEWADDNGAAVCGFTSTVGCRP